MFRVLINFFLVLFFILKNCSYACEGEKAWLQCQPYEAIRVLRVFWGREEDQLGSSAKICSDPPAGLKTNIACESDDDSRFKKVKNQCQNREGNNSFFIYKVLCFD